MIEGAALTDFAGVGVAVGFVFVGVYVVIAVISIVAAVEVVTKAGYSGWWVVVALVPGVGFVMALVFAFSKWPVLREVEAFRAQRANVPWAASGQGQGGAGSSGFSGDGGYPPAAPFATGTAPGPGTRPPQATVPEPPLPALGAVLSVAADPLPASGDAPGGTGGDVDEPAGPGSGPFPSQPTAGSPSAYPPAGWFPTPDGRLRYWDGAAWTDHFS
jgi:Protein of unknown function (DUF2510)